MLAREGVLREFEKGRREYLGDAEFRRAVE